MAPFSVVEGLDVFDQADVGGLVVEPAFVAGQLGLERMEARLGHGVVPAVSLAAHALHETVVGNPHLAKAVQVYWTPRSLRDNAQKVYNRGTEVPVPVPQAPGNRKVSRVPTKKRRRDVTVSLRRQAV